MYQKCFLERSFEKRREPLPGWLTGRRGDGTGHCWGGYGFIYRGVDEGWTRGVKQ